MIPIKIYICSVVLETVERKLHLARYLGAIALLCILVELPFSCVGRCGEDINARC